ncbi:MAG TPA: flippase-like domain-containing protein [Thermoanaerobaculia bacterium]|nr:flippase-like domain-containing protein [Thermoanaerobaculia bacterium]
MPAMTPAPRSALGRWRRPLILLLLATALVFSWRLVAGLSWRALGHRVAGANWLLLAGAALCLVVRYLLWDHRLRLASGRAVAKRPRLGVGFFALLATAALNLLTPSARVVGGPMRARYLARSVERPFARLYGVVLFDQLAHSVVMTAWTWLAVIAVAWVLGRAWLGAAAFAALALVLGCALLWSRRRASSPGSPAGSLADFFSRKAERANGRGERLYGQGSEAAGALEGLLGERQLRLPAVALGAGFFLLSVLAQWLVFAALGHSESPLVVSAVVALGAAAGMLTGTPGGAGTTEAAMVTIFVALGVARGDAAAGTIVFRGLTYAADLALGIPALIWFELRYGARASAQVPEPLPIEEAA